jgi:hypothetical protein
MSRQRRFRRLSVGVASVTFVDVIVYPLIVHVSQAIIKRVLTFLQSSASSQATSVLRPKASIIKATVVRSAEGPVITASALLGADVQVADGLFVSALDQGRRQHLAVRCKLREVGDGGTGDPHGRVDPIRLILAVVVVPLNAVLLQRGEVADAKLIGSEAALIVLKVGGDGPVAFRSWVIARPVRAAEPVVRGVVWTKGISRTQSEKRAESQK